MLLVRGGIVLTSDPELPVISDGAVAVKDTDIIAVDRYDDLIRKYPASQVIGSKNHWVLPGFVNAHSHCGVISGFRQGIPDLPLERWLMRIYNSCLTEEQTNITHLNTLYYCSQLLKSGVTCTSDFHYTHAGGTYLGTEHGLQGYQEAGIRVAFFLAAMDQPAFDNGNLDPFLPLLPQDLAKRVKSLEPVPFILTSKEFIEAWKRIHEDFQDVDGILNICLGPDGPTRCTPEFMKEIKKVVAEWGSNIQMHLLETKYQRLYALKENYGSVVKYLDSISFLGPEVSLAHSIWLSSEDIDLISKAGSSTVYNASSNLRILSGIAPVHNILAGNINVAIGTDAVGFSDDNDFLDEMRLAALLQRVPGIEGNYLTGRKLFEMATINGARALGLEKRTGSLSPGKAADILTISSDRMLSPYMSPMQEPEEILWRRARREDVRDVLVNGRILMENGTITSFDVSSTADSLKEWYEKIWAARGEREKQIFSLLREIDAYVIKFFEQYETTELRAGYEYNLY